MRRKILLGSVIAIVFVFSLWNGAHAGYIYIKAYLANFLIETAWQETIETKQNTKPWSWADTWPVGRILVERLGVDELILEGASGRNMAFGLTHISGTSSPDKGGNTGIAGHRDTHFAFLEQIEKDDVVSFENKEGVQSYYAVSDMRVVDESDVSVLSETDSDHMTLITCYPFNAVIPGGSLRYVVTADKVS